MNINILFVCLYDYANIQAEWCKFLEKKFVNDNKITVKYICYKDNIKKRFNYTSPLNTITFNQSENFYDIVENYIIENNINNVFFEGEDIEYYSLINRLSLKKNINFNIFHNGSNYRKNFVSTNSYDKNPLINKIIYGSDLYYLGKGINPSKKIVILPVKYTNFNYTEEDIINKFNCDKVIILHCPSSKRRKGSHIIRTVVNNILLKYNLYNKYEYIELTNKTNDEIMLFKKKSHIYIDQFFPDIGGFGVSAIEALVCGNIVLSSMNNIPQGVLPKNFPIIPINDYNYLENTLIKLFLLQRKQLLNIAISTFVNYNKEYDIDNFSKKILDIC